jgi:hypothetical protein
MVSRVTSLLEQIHEESGARGEIDINGTIIVTPGRRIGSACPLYPHRMCGLS